MNDIEEIIKLEPFKSCYEYGESKGRADYEAECEKIFEDNPPMHFSTEQIMWIKEYIKHARASERVDAIAECIGYLQGIDNYVADMVEDIFKLKEQSND